MNQQTDFDPMTDIPQTDEQVEIALMFDKAELIGKNLVGLYKIYRAKGQSLLEAYEHALLAHLEVAASSEGAELLKQEAGEKS